MYIIRCSKAYPDLALAELQAYNPSAKYISQGLYSSNTINHLSLLAQVTHAYEHVYTGDLEQSPLLLTDNTFSVRTAKCTDLEKKNAQAFIYYSQKKPVVRLENPDEEYFCQKVEKNTYVFGKLIYTNKTIYSINSQKEVIHFKPITLAKKLARTLVNLSGVEKGVIHDPFCGFGGIVYEALECEHITIGTDIDTQMIQGATEYLQSLTSDKLKLSIDDALTTTIQSDAIVSDLPFGKATKNISSTLYKDFLVHVKNTKITKKLVLGFPDFHNPLEIIKDCGLQPTHIFTIYIHKSLSRIIVVIPIN